MRHLFSRAFSATPPAPVTPPPPPGLVIAHRGGLAHAPENSVAAIREAAARGAHAVELDVRRRGDRLVCAHDRGQDGPDAARALGVALDLGLRVEFDLKGSGVDGAVEALAALLDREAAHARVWVSTFQPLAAWRLRHADPRLVVGWSAPAGAHGPWALGERWLRWLGVQVVEPAYALLTPERVAGWQAAGLVVETWGLPESEADALRAQGVSVVLDALG